MLIMSYAIKFVKEKPKILLTNEQMFSIINSAANTFEAIEKEGDVMQGYDEALKLIFAYPSEEEMRAAQAVCCGRRCSACETPAAYAWRKRTVDMSLLLEKAMENELTVTERETLKAFWFETMPVGAIARLKGISSAAVSDTLARAQEKLKKALRYAVLYQYDTLDEETVLASVAKTGCVVTAEEHSIIGGLGGAVAELLAEKAPAPLERIGLRDCFGTSGEFDELVAEFGLDASSIAQAALRAIARK